MLAKVLAGGIRLGPCGGRLHSRWAGRGREAARRRRGPSGPTLEPQVAPDSATRRITASKSLYACFLAEVPCPCCMRTWKQPACEPRRLVENHPRCPFEITDSLVVQPAAQLPLLRRRDECPPSTPCIAT